MSLVTNTVPIGPPGWIQDVDVAPGASVVVCATGTGFLGVNTAPPSGRPCTAGGAIPPFPFVGNAASFGYYAAYFSDSVVATGPYGIVFAARQTGSGPPSVWTVGSPPTFVGSWDGSTSPVTDAFAPGNGTPYTYTNNTGFTQTLWSVFNGLGGTFYWSDYSGGPFTVTYNDAISTTPTLSAVQSGTSVALSWTPVVGAATYTIERNGIIIATGIAATSYTDSAVSNGNTYTYNVQAIAPCQFSNLSNAVTVMVGGWTKDCSGPNVAWASDCPPPDSTMTKSPSPSPSLSTWTKAR